MTVNEENLKKIEIKVNDLHHKFDTIINQLIRKRAYEKKINAHEKSIIQQKIFDELGFKKNDVIYNSNNVIKINKITLES